MADQTTHTEPAHDVEAVTRAYLRGEATYEQMRAAEDANREDPLIGVTKHLIRGTEAQSTLTRLATLLGCAPDEVLATVQRWREALEHYADDDVWSDDGFGYEDRHYRPDRAGWHTANDALGQATREGAGG